MLHGYQANRPTIYYEGEKLKGIDVIIPRVGQSITEYGAAVVRQFEMMKVQSSIPSIALVRSRDKLRSLQLLARAGVGIPRQLAPRRRYRITDRNGWRCSAGC